MFFLILCHIVEKWLKFSFSFSPPTDKVDAYAIKKKKKWLCGFSDRKYVEIVPAS